MDKCARKRNEDTQDLNTKKNCNEKQWPKQQPQNTMKRKRSHTVLKIIYIIHYHHQRSQQFNIASFVLFVHLNI